MAGDREAVGLVAHPLDQPRGRAMRLRGCAGASAPCMNSRSCPGLRSGPFATPTSIDVVEAELVQHLDAPRSIWPEPPSISSRSGGGDLARP